MTHLPPDIAALRAVVLGPDFGVPSDSVTPDNVVEMIEKLREAGPPTEQDVASMGLGDYVAAGLSAVGITKERVSAALGRPCGCEARQEWMNRVGAEYLGIGTAQNSH